MCARTKRPKKQFAYRFAIIFPNKVHLNTQDFFFFLYQQLESLIISLWYTGINYLSSLSIHQCLFAKNVVLPYLSHHHSNMQERCIWVSKEKQQKMHEKNTKDTRYTQKTEAWKTSMTNQPIHLSIWLLITTNTVR